MTVTEVDKKQNRVKIHFVGYSNKYDEWRSCNYEDINNVFQRLEPYTLPSNISLKDRSDVIYGELYKRRLYSGRRDDPGIRIDVRIDVLIFALKVFTILLPIFISGILDLFKIFFIIRAKALSAFSPGHFSTDLEMV